MEPANCSASKGFTDISKYANNTAIEKGRGREVKEKLSKQ